MGGQHSHKPSARTLLLWVRSPFRFSSLHRRHRTGAATSLDHQRVSGDTIKMHDFGGVRFIARWYPVMPQNLGVMDEQSSPVRSRQVMRTGQAVGTALWAVQLGPGRWCAWH